DYAALRDMERALLARALEGVSVWRLRVAGHEWAELLPELMNGHATNGRHAANGHATNGSHAANGRRPTMVSGVPAAVPAELPGDAL
ncbi:MAG: hypothetical protein ABR509_01040, partial [Candidatus Limnocylindria bacterium]